MSDVVFLANTEADTDRLGRLLAELLPDAAVVALSGTLGAGKTRLVQAIAAASGIDRHEVTSPTFVLCHTYRGERTIHHFDVYRLKDEQEFLELGPEEYFQSGSLSLIEWADKVADLLPLEHLQIRIEVTGPTQRRFVLKPQGALLEQAVAQIGQRLVANDQ